MFSRYIIAYVFKHKYAKNMQKYAICKICKLKNIFLESPNGKTNFCPGSAALPISCRNIHLHKDPLCNDQLLNEIFFAMWRSEKS